MTTSINEYNKINKINEYKNIINKSPSKIFYSKKL